MLLPSVQQNLLSFPLLFSLYSFPLPLLVSIAWIVTTVHLSTPSGSLGTSKLWLFHFYFRLTVPLCIFLLHVRFGFFLFDHHPHKLKPQLLHWAIIFSLLSKPCYSQLMRTSDFILNIFQLTISCFQAFSKWMLILKSFSIFPLLSIQNWTFCFPSLHFLSVQIRYPFHQSLISQQTFKLFLFIYLPLCQSFFVKAFLLEFGQTLLQHAFSPFSWNLAVLEHFRTHFANFPVLYECRIKESNFEWGYRKNLLQVFWNWEKLFLIIQKDFAYPPEKIKICNTCCLIFSLMRRICLDKPSWPKGKKF